MKKTWCIVNEFGDKLGKNFYDYGLAQKELDRIVNFNSYGDKNYLFIIETSKLSLFD